MLSQAFLISGQPMPELPGADEFEVVCRRSQSSLVLNGWKARFSLGGGSSEKEVGMGFPRGAKNLSESIFAMVLWST